MARLDNQVSAMVGAVPPSWPVYARAFFADWGRWLSGGASIVLAVATALIPNIPAQLALATFALLCGLFATYQIWKSERQRVCELEEKLKYKIRLRLNERKGPPSLHVQEHVFVENLGPHGIEQCQVILEKVECRKGGGPFETVPHFQAALPLGWCFLKFNDPEKYAPQLLPPNGHLVDFLTAKPDVMLPDGRPFFQVGVDPGHGIYTAFSEHGTYRFTLRASSPHTASDPLILLSTWNGITSGLTVRPETP
jgi:hypothetical protein